MRLLRLGTQSARKLRRFGFALASAVLVPGLAVAQLTTGVIEGTLRALDGSSAAGAEIVITGGTGFRTVIHSDSNGEFVLTLPYGRYSLSGSRQPGAVASGVTVFVAPLQTARVDMVIGPSGAIAGLQAPRTLGIWTDASIGRLYPEGFSLPGLLLSREPSSVTEPLDFTGLGDNRLARRVTAGIFLDRHAIQASWDGCNRFLSARTSGDSARRRSAR